MNKVSLETIDLFDCLTERQKASGKRKGIRLAKRANFIFKINNYFKRGKNNA